MIDFDELDRKRAAAQELSNRAWRIVDRLLPSFPSAHGWHDPVGFITSSRRRGDRKYLFFLVEAKLISKQTGQPPQIKLPTRGEPVIGALLKSASEALAEDADKAWKDAIKYVREERCAA